MQLHFLKNHQIDKSRWLQTILQSPNGLLYARPQYLDALSPGWEALVNEDYSLLMPLTIRRKWGIRYLYQPAFCQQLGIFGTAAIDENVVKEFLHAVQQNISFAEINLNFCNRFAADAAFPRKNYVLHLAGDYEAIRALYSKNLIKKNLQRTEKFQLQYTTSYDPAFAIDTYREFYASRTPHVGKKEYLAFAQICRQLQATGNAFVREVRLPNNELLSCDVFLKDDRRIYYMVSSTLPNGRTLGANHFLLDKVIQEFANSNLLLDFEGSDIPGIEWFYKNFGALNQPYFFTRWNGLPWPLRLLKK